MSAVSAAEEKEAKKSSEKLHEEDGTPVMQGVTTEEAWTNYVTQWRIEHADELMAEDDVTGLPLNAAGVAEGRRV